MGVAVTAARRDIIAPRIARSAVRMFLALAAFEALWFANPRYERCRDVTAVEARCTAASAITWLAPIAVAGLLFASAVNPPSRLRYRFGLPTVFAVILVLLLAHPIVLLTGWDLPGFLFFFRWYMYPPSPFVMAAMLGVALARGFWGEPGSVDDVVMGDDPASG